MKTVDVPRRAAQPLFARPTPKSSELARYALVIEQHYGRPMDIEWGKDGVDGKLYILQARPETVKSQQQRQGRAALQAQGQRHRAGRGPRDRPEDRHRPGPDRPQHRATWTRCRPGDVLVTDMTDPNWEPVMKRASAIVTNRGGRTCHAAIIARELGIPAVVGTGSATGSPARTSSPRRCRRRPLLVTEGLREFTVTETRGWTTCPSCRSS